ncbi:MAG: hypothetical protein P3T54_00920 [Dehalogenimonas sp.]|jgi:hypothetical protein|uniref:Uncharacterized protein n=1 Tax=Candidatus Dehalogenimonas loeffleri TaxID=3127115 RepID=A0ABZ2J0Z1_9CHLR|nr:hypothetical protein [Dehalogenimonas sp.]
MFLKHIKHSWLTASLVVLVLALSACSLSLPAIGDPITPPVTLGAPDQAAGLNSISGALAHDGVQPPYVLYPDGPVVKLVNNPAASDPTWAELLAFIRSDSTDRNAYLQDLYMCGGFAQDLHNAAEAAGIRAGWVAIDFTDRAIGHAATVFQTTDRGLVVIDATSSYDTGGRGLGQVLSDSYDKVAYVQIGSEYGVISLEVAASPFYNDYLTYLERLESFETLRADYETQVTEYNQAVSSGSYNYSYLKSWYNRLEDLRLEMDALADTLGGYYWETMGIVRAATIYW